MVSRLRLFGGSFSLDTDVQAVEVADHEQLQDSDRGLFTVLIVGIHWVSVIFRKITLLKKRPLLCAVEREDHRSACSRVGRIEFVNRMCSA